MLEVVNHTVGWNYYALEPESAKQTFVARLPLESVYSRISADGRQVAYSLPDGDSYSIRAVDAGPVSAETRVLCKGCGAVEGFPPDGRFLLYDPGAKVKEDPKRMKTVSLVEVASGRDRPWLEDPTDSIEMGGAVAKGSEWRVLSEYSPDSPHSRQSYLIRWTEQPPPHPEWARIPLPEGTGTVSPLRISPVGTFLHFFEEQILYPSDSIPRRRPSVSVTK